MIANWSNSLLLSESDRYSNDIHRSIDRFFHLSLRTSKPIEENTQLIGKNLSFSRIKAIAPTEISLVGEEGFIRQHSMMNINHWSVSIRLMIFCSTCSRSSITSDVHSFVRLIFSFLFFSFRSSSSLKFIKNLFCSLVILSNTTIVIIVLNIFDSIQVLSQRIDQQHSNPFRSKTARLSITRLSPSICRQSTLIDKNWFTCEIEVKFCRCFRGKVWYLNWLSIDRQRERTKNV